MQQADGLCARLDAIRDLALDLLNHVTRHRARTISQQGFVEKVNRLVRMWSDLAREYPRMRVLYEELLPGLERLARLTTSVSATAHYKDVLRAIVDTLTRFCLLDAVHGLHQRPTLTFDDLHPLIRDVAEPLYRDAHLSQAIFEAFKAVVNYVKTKSGCQDRDGTDLMAHVFNERAPILALNSLNSRSERDEQAGFKLIMMGVTLAIRNPAAHEIRLIRDPIQSMELLALASFLLRRIDEAQKLH